MRFWPGEILFRWNKTAIYDCSINVYTCWLFNNYNFYIKKVVSQDCANPKRYKRSHHLEKWHSFTHAKIRRDKVSSLGVEDRLLWGLIQVIYSRIQYQLGKLWLLMQWISMLPGCFISVWATWSVSMHKGSLGLPLLFMCNVMHQFAWDIKRT